MAFFFRETVTVPLPADPDSEIERWFNGNVTFGNIKPVVNNSKTPPNKTTPVLVSEPLFTPDENGHVTVEQQQAWMYMTEGILYYAFPIEIIWGIISGFVSLIVIARQKKTSNDSYLIGFQVASVLLLICGAILKVQDYISHNNQYQYVYGYIKSANDWLWYSALWILVVMTLERGLTLIQNRNKTFCSALQASIIIIMIFCVCLISALPEFWEYEAIETFDYVSNRTIIISHVSQTADSPEYKIMYFWYSVTITVFLPYPIMIIMIITLTQGMKQSRHSRHRQHKHSTGTILNRKISEELHLTRLYIVMILLYILLTAPLTFLIIVNGITPNWSWPDDNLYNGLYLIFEFVFYFFFSIQSLLYLSYYDKFRHSFLRLCCCCCCRDNKRNKKYSERTRLEQSSSLQEQTNSLQEQTNSLREQPRSRSENSLRGQRKQHFMYT